MSVSLLQNDPVDKFTMSSLARVGSLLLSRLALSRMHILQRRLLPMNTTTPALALARVVSGGASRAIILSNACTFIPDSFGEAIAC